MLLLITATLLALAVSADAGATLAIEAVQFSNAKGTLKNGEYCEGWLYRSDHCDHKFKFCLFPNTDGCGSIFTTGVYYDNDKVNFGSPLMKGEVHNPMKHHIDGRFEGSLSLKVIVLEDDTYFYNDDDDVDTFEIRESISSYDGTVTRDYRGMRPNDSTSLQLTLSLTCDANYFGPGCNVLCAPSASGHYSCDNRSGKKLCLPGWTGPNCIQPVCKQGCARDRGRCTKPGECICNYGYQGDICNQLVNPCLKDVPCANGGTCSSKGTVVGQFECSCVAGYTGDRCEVDIDDCASNPCKNGGTCTDKVTDYECSCPDTLDGSEPPKNCSGPPCRYLLCKNNGTCIGREGGNASTSPAAEELCACLEGFAGLYCELDVPDSAGDDVSNWLKHTTIIVGVVSALLAVFFYILWRYLRNSRLDVTASRRLLIQKAARKLKRPVTKIYELFKEAFRSLAVMCRLNKKIKYSLLSQSDESLDLNIHTGPRSDSVTGKKNSYEYRLLSPEPRDDYVLVDSSSSNWPNKPMSTDGRDEDMENGTAAKYTYDDQALYILPPKKEPGDFV